MNAFQSAQMVEATALTRLRPYIIEKAEGRFVETNKGALAPFLQEVVGDIVMNDRNGRTLCIELKAEEDDRHGNFFLETWSNKNLNSRESHAMRGSNPGWMLKLRADLLFYYFIGPDRLYILPLFKLQQWAFGKQGEKGAIYGYPERPQSKRDQLNDTHGRCVPIRDVLNHVGGKLVHPLQLELPGVAA